MRGKTMFLGLLALATIVLFACQPKQEKQPNIIYIYTDQQSETMMSCAGNKYLKTPAMDYIAENGIRFTRAYTTNPVCSPARVSMMTGRFPGSHSTFQSNICQLYYIENCWRAEVSMLWDKSTPLQMIRNWSSPWWTVYQCHRYRP